MAWDMAEETDIEFVRHELDALAAWRCSTGLSAAEGRRYQELCRLERSLMEKASSAA
jgi:hypothetical protein